MVRRLITMHVTHVVSLLTVLTFGCAHRAPSALPASPPPAREPRSSPSPAPQNDPSSAALAVASAPVIVTGVLERRGQEIEICPGQSVGPCAGIRVVGKVEAAWLSERGRVAVWRLSGAYDGTTLAIDAPARPAGLADPDYRNSCPEFQKPVRGGNPDERSSAEVEAFAREHRDRIAGQWWDRERQTMVVWVTGDATQLRRSLAERAPDVRVCVQGHARFSEAELESARARADRVLKEHGVTWSSSWGDVVKNQVVYNAEAIDARTLAQLAREVGDAIRVVAFIELPAHRLEQMPVPEPRGDVALVTAKTRSGAGMSALGRFTVHYDPALRCVYLDAQGERLLPVWPFGYWATSSPFRVFDYDGNVVAEAGATLEMGGGQVEAQHAGTTNTCGAKHAWIGQPQQPSLRR